LSLLFMLSPFGYVASVMPVKSMTRQVRCAGLLQP